MAKKVSWKNLKSELDDIFGKDEEVVSYEDGDYKEYATKSKVLDFFTGENPRKLKDVNIELLSQSDEIPYEDCSEDGDDVNAVFALEDKIYRVKFTHYSYSGFSLEYATAEEVAPKIKQIVYYE